LWVRSFDALEPRAIPGTDDAAHPFWSPDSRRIGFASFGKVRHVAATGGPVQTVGDQDLLVRSGGTWNQEDKILFIQSPRRLVLVSASGGAVTAVPVHDASGQLMGIG